MTAKTGYQRLRETLDRKKLGLVAVRIGSHTTINIRQEDVEKVLDLEVKLND